MAPRLQGNRITDDFPTHTVPTELIQKRKERAKNRRKRHQGDMEYLYLGVTIVMLVVTIGGFLNAVIPDEVISYYREKFGPPPPCAEYQKYGYKPGLPFGDEDSLDLNRILGDYSVYEGIHHGLKVIHLDPIEEGTGYNLAETKEGVCHLELP